MNTGTEDLVAGAKHTPGPWHWECEDQSMATLYGPDTDTGPSHVVTLTICKNCQQGHEGWEWGRCYTAQEADARLLAVAPELLEALQTVMGDADHGQNMTWDERCKIARSAISKATGS